MAREINFDDYNNEVVKSEKLVLIDFFATWCGPCKMMAPIVEKLAEIYEGKVKVGKCNVDEEGELARKYRVMSIPTMIIFVNGEVKETIIGATSQKELEEKIEKVLA